MSHINRLGLFMLCVLIINCLGCRTKEPIVAPPSRPAKTGEGPLLAPPQQQTPPATPQGDHAALPTAGDPAGTSATNTPAATPAETTQAAQPTEGDPSG